jgi:hypothetical protein
LDAADQGETAAEGRRPWEWVVASAIVALAAWLRLRELDLAEFKLDEAVAVDLARDVLHGRWPVVGLRSSVGALNPPLFVYLMALPLAVRNDPLAATAFVGVLATVAVALTYVALRPRFGAFTALGAAALFATSPWAVLFGRKIWAQDVLPVVTVTLLWTLLVTLERTRTRIVLLVPVLVCAAFQLNFSALALAVPVGILLLYRAREVHWPAFIAGTALAVLLLAPWLGHETTHGFNDLRTLLLEGRGGGPLRPGAGSIEAIVQTTRIIGSTGWDYRGAGGGWTLGRPASLLAAALLALGLVTSTLQAVRGARGRRGLPWLEFDDDSARRALLLVWLAGVWLSYVASRADRVYSHYLIVTYPVSFAIMAVGLSDTFGAVRREMRRAAAVAATAVLVGLAIAFVAFTLSFHHTLNNQGGTPGSYGVVYRDKAALARTVRERGFRVLGDRVLDFLVTGEMDAPLRARPVVIVRNRLKDSTPLACNGVVRSFGPLMACLPPAGQ